jgi:hypothetical protein
MKRIIVYIIIGFCFISCKGQNQEFDNYISNFHEIKLPFLVDRRDSINRIYARTSKEIPINYIKKFICIDSLKCDTNPAMYEYDYMYTYNLKQSFIIVLLSKGKYKGKTCYDFDLGETLLIVYTKDGKIIDEKSIAKDNDCWLSSILVINDSIKVQQIKVVDPTQFKIIDNGMDCEIETKIYQISDDGYINLIRTDPIKKGVLVFDEKIDDFILKK